MRVIKEMLSDIESKTFDIGFVGEKNHTCVMINCVSLFNQYPDAVATMVAKPPVGNIYPVILHRDDIFVVWNVSESDLAHAGSGQYQLTFTDGEGDNAEIIKTVYGSFSVKPSMVSNGEAPDPIEDWLEEANEAMAEFGKINELSASATTLPAGQQATAEITNVNGHKNIAIGIPKGDKGDKGDDGDPAPAEEVTAAVDAYLAENFSNPSNPPLDRSLSSSSSAAPADLVGNLKSAFNYVQNDLPNGTPLPFTYKGKGNWDGQGTFTPGSPNYDCAIFTIPDNAISTKIIIDGGYYFNGLLFDKDMNRIVLSPGMGWVTEFTVTDLNVKYAAIRMSPNSSGSSAAGYDCYKKFHVYSKTYADAKTEGDLEKTNDHVDALEDTIITGEYIPDIEWRGWGSADATGAFTPGDPYRQVSDFIEIPERVNKTYVSMSAAAFLITLYDENKTRLGSGGSIFTEYTIDVEEAKYFILQLLNQNGTGTDGANFKQYLTVEMEIIPSYNTIDNKISSALSYKEEVKTTYVTGRISSGEVVSGNHRVSEFIELTDKIDYYTITVTNNTYGVYVVGYDSSKTRIGAINSSYDSNLIIRNHLYKYFRIELANKNGGQATGTEDQYVHIERTLIPAGVNFLPNYGNVTYKRKYFTVNNNNGDQIDCMIKMNPDYSVTGKPSKLLMVCHGSGYYVKASEDKYGANTAATENMLNYFNNAGFFLFDVNGYTMESGGGEIWGCQNGVDIYRKAYQYIVDNYNVEKAFSIYAFSMGGLSALNLLGNHMPGIKCAILSAPVCSIYEECWKHNYAVGSDKTIIKTAYSFTGNDYEADKVIGCDPFQSMFIFSDTINDEVGGQTDYLGSTITELTEGATTNPITSSGGNSKTVYNGNIYLYDETPFIYVGGVWHNMKSYLKEYYTKELPPIKIWHGDADTVPYLYSLRLFNAMQRGNSNAEYVLVNGADHGICWGNVPSLYPDYVAFLNRVNN